jgi:hypothetical protein
MFDHVSLTTAGDHLIVVRREERMQLSKKKNEKKARG